MAERHADEAIQPTSTMIKRRGLLAGAAVLVAGIAAKQTSQPITANDQVWSLPYTGSVSDPSTWAFTVANTGSGGIGINGSGVETGVSGSGGHFGVYGSSGGSNSGLLAGRIGVGGQCLVADGTGVHGYTSTGSNSKAVYGQNTGSGYGVYGESASGHGVYGTSTGSHAIFGNLFAPVNSGYAGVFGFGNGAGTFGVIGNGAGGTGVSGSTTSAGGIGVQGTAAAGSGVVGTGVNGVVGNTSSVGGYGGFFTTIANQSTAVGGQIFGSTSGSAAFVGAASAGNYAAFFTGTVVVNGALVISGGGKSAAVKHPRTGDYRALYCEESPDSWFADYGEGKLAGGKAEVKLDPDFAVLIHTDGYQVFLTEYGETEGLYVANRSGAGFTVQERNKGTSNAAFGYRVVGKRSDIKLERLAKVTMPTLTMPQSVAEAVPVTEPSKTPVVQPAPAPSPRAAAPATVPAASAQGNTSPTAAPSVVQPIPPPRP